MRLSNLAAMLFAVLVAVFTVNPIGAETPNPQHLGEPVSEAGLAGLNITVFPDGQGLPEGSGNAVGGESLYRMHCLACHGANGQNGINDALTGGIGTLTGNQPQKTVGSFWPYATTLFDYVRRAMPYNAPGSLDNDELYAITAYVLYMNNIISDKNIMNAKTLPAVVMPNRDGFSWPDNAEIN